LILAISVEEIQTL
jgi:hypothetical protein